MKFLNLLKTKQNSKANTLKAFIIAATQSGAGKTTITLGFLAALKKRGFSPQSFKVGPDFIDPGHHKKVTGKDCINLDLFMLSKSDNRRLFYSNSIDHDISVIEGVMGLFDGFSKGFSTADMAKLLDIPVLLVVDVSSMGESVGALVDGFLNYDKRVNIKWLLFNNVGSNRHKQLIINSLTDKIKKNAKILGFLPKNPKIKIPSRHLGLYTDFDDIHSNEFWDNLSEFMENNIKIGEFIDSIPLIHYKEKFSNRSQSKTPKKRAKNCLIGVALDNAFCFYYPDNIRLLQDFGAKIHYFSPTFDDSLPSDISGIYLGGGYPELYADKLSKNSKMFEILRELAIKRKIGIYAECGGLMYLSRYIYTGELDKFQMLGILPVSVKMLDKRKALGYREVELQKDCILGKRGLKARGHEFHYSAIIEEDVEQNLYYYKFNDTENGNKSCIKKEGFNLYNVVASYVHIHFLSEPLFAKNFVNYCEKVNNI